MLMPLHPSTGTTAREVWTCRGVVLGLLVLAATLHLVYMINDCPLDLAPDEAHYWDWSRHLDWSYYSKGPLVAWLIRGSCAVFGPLSQALTGNLMLAVRLPAVVCGMLLLLSLYVLTALVHGSERLALGVVAIALTLPPIAAGSSLMTIDAPYTCCWGWALVAGYHAIFRRAWWGWPLAGLLVGLGTLAKYTMVLWIPSVGLFLLATPAYRFWLRRPGFWIMSCLAGLCCLPILFWNIQNNWVTLRHVNTLATGHTQTLIHWNGPLVFLGGQALLLLGVWFVIWVAAMIAHRPWRESEPGLKYLWWLSAPMFVNFLLFSFKNGGGEINWPVTAYLSGLVLAAGWLVQQFQQPRTWARLLLFRSVIGVCVAGLLVVFFMYESQKLRFILVPLAGKATEAQPCPLRRVDPTCRLRGWRTLAQEVDRVRAEERLREGAEPVVAGMGWSLPGELGFYCEGHPQVYSIGLIHGDRHSQYDLWHPNPTDDPEHFRGRTFVIVGGLTPTIRAAFAEVEPLRWVIHREDGHPIVQWPILIARGFRGFPVPQGGQRSY